MSLTDLPPAVVIRCGGQLRHQLRQNIVFNRHVIGRFIPPFSAIKIDQTHLQGKLKQRHLARYRWYQHETSSLLFSKRDGAEY